MKHRFLVFLLSLSACAAFGSIIPWGKSPAPAEIGQLVAEAATYQPGQSREALRRIEELVGQSTAEAATRDALEAGLVQLLAPSATFEARRFACKQLGIIGGKSALPTLAGLLKSDENAGIACLALTTYPPGKADETLRDALASAPRAARVQIINTLGDRRDSDSVKLLAGLAKDADPSVAEAAIASLGKIGDKDAWDMLASLRKTATPNLAPALTEASLRCAANLAAAGDRKPATAAYEGLLAASEPTYVRRAALAGLLRREKDSGEKRILSVLRGSDSTLKPVAIAAIPALRSKRASQTFAAELPRLQPQEQVWMIESLASRGDPAARDAIAKSLGAPDPAVRRAALSALSRIGDASSVPLFSRALAGASDADERRAIESALIALGGGTPTDNAILVELKKASGNARVSLIAVLARRQGPAANSVLFEETNSSDPAVAKAAFRALAKTAAGTDVPALLKQLAKVRDAEVRAEAESAAAQALGKMDDAPSRSLAVISALRQAPNIEATCSFVCLLPRCGDAQALAILQSAQQDPDAHIRDAAVRALTDWPDAAAWDPLVSIYRRGATEAVRGLALRGLVRLAGDENAHPDAKLTERYRQLLEGSRGDPDLRLILGTLGGAASPDTLQLALPLLANANVRPEAEVAVKKIAEAIRAKHPQEAQEALLKIQTKQ
jgi:HEAT repeat protein